MPLLLIHLANRLMVDFAQDPAAGVRRHRPAAEAQPRDQGEGDRRERSQQQVPGISFSRFYLWLTTLYFFLASVIINPQTE